MPVGPVPVTVRAAAAAAVARRARSALFAAALGLAAGCGTSPGATLADRAERPGSPAPVPTPVRSSPLPPPAVPAPGDAVVPGPVVAPYPTLHFVTLMWPFSGDANRDAAVAVRFREAGTATWLDAMPLRRVEPGSNAGFGWGGRFAGSLFDLAADTDYEVELALHDPDGARLTHRLAVRTRPVPAPMPRAPTRAATPADFADVLRAARPGDVVTLAEGRYAWPATLGDGQPGRPIVIRSSAGATIVGEVALMGRRHVHLHGLTVEGRIRLNGSEEIAITRCTVRASAALAGDGIVAYTRSRNAYIADNTVIGITPWAASSLGVHGRNLGEGIVVTGPGHVIMNNRVRGFRDGISLMEAGEAVEQHSIDIVGNEVSEAADDGIEADFCLHNCRVVRNRLTNVFVAMSAQPSLGGPTWFVRNVAYNVAHVPFKLYRGSIGDVLLHNTVVKGGDAFGMAAGRPVSALMTRNNLFIGGPGGTFGGWSSGRGDVVSIPDLVLAGADLDHDAFGSTAPGFRGTVGGVHFVGLDALRAATTMRHALRVDPSVFAAPVVVPTAAMTVYPAPDLRPRAGSAVHGRAERLPTINARPDGGAPSIGAYEPDAPPRVYGPR